MIANVREHIKQCTRWTRSVSRWTDVTATLRLWLIWRNNLAGMGGRRRYLLDRLRLRCSALVSPTALNGYRLRIDPRLDDLLIYQECFIDNVYDLSALPFDPDVVIDCGGYAGYFSLLAKARFPQSKVLVFEPHPDNFNAMLANFELNGIATQPYCAAVSTYDGETWFSGSGCAGRLGVPEAAAPRRVAVVNLSKLITTLAPKALLLKIDVEGEEKHILPSLVQTLPATCAVYFEWHHTESTFNDIHAILAAHGFEVRRLRVRPALQGCVYLDAFALRA